MADDKPPLSAATPNVPQACPPVAEPMNLPPISLAGSKPAPAISTNAGRQDAEIQKDAFREMLETIVFVVVLVLMLKTFLAEAFVIPTGSMATTLLGYHHKEICEECGYPNLINASREAEADEPQNINNRVAGYHCINCRKYNKLRQEPGPREVPK